MDADTPDPPNNSPDIAELASVGPCSDSTETSQDAITGVPTYQSSHDELSSQSFSHQLERRNNKKTPDDVAFRFLALVESGIGARAAATECNLNIKTAYAVLARSDADVETLRAATAKLMAVETIDRIDDWRTAARIGAQKKGNHAPARDWLLHAGVIDNLASESNVNVRVAIQIGTDDKPMRIASPLSRKTDDD